MIIRELKIVNNIVETGCTNSLIGSIDTIIECQNNVALLMPKYTLIVNKGGVYHKIIFNRHKKPIGYDYDLITCDQYRLTWYYESLDGCCHHSEINTFRLVGIIKQLINDQGQTLKTYNGLEVNHLLPRIYKVNNKIDNLELCTESENKRHFQAWLKCQIYNERIPIQLSAIGELVPFILSSNTKLVAMSDNYFTLRNYNWNGDIVEYTCKLNEDGVWRFNG